ncbi:hypothetical protein HanPI659440_Chr15g0584371 [Helianthus annuus]|nr:hypothetical protein HanPI659440_Chr15g0584371 [Helianthus annuus]
MVLSVTKGVGDLMNGVGIEKEGMYRMMNRILKVKKWIIRSGIRFKSGSIGLIRLWVWSAMIDLISKTIGARVYGKKLANLAYRKR